MTDSNCSTVTAEALLRGWAKAYRDTPEHRFPSDPNAEFFPVDLEYAADEIARLRGNAQGQSDRGDIDSVPSCGQENDYRRAARPVPGGDKGGAKPFLWICLVPGKWEPENIRAWTRDPDRAAQLTDDGLDMKPLYAAPQPASNAGGETWEPVDFWKFVSGLAGEFEAGQMRDMLAQRGLRIVGISDPAYAAPDPALVQELADVAEREIIPATRMETIEECAQVAAKLDPEGYKCVRGHDRCEYGADEECPYCEHHSPIAAAIRALSIPSTPSRTEEG